LKIETNIIEVKICNLMLWEYEERTGACPS